MQPVEQLRAARALITPVERWCKGTAARTADGALCDPRDYTAVSWCAVGALYKAAGYKGPTADVIQTLWWASGAGQGPSFVNDHHGHAATLEMFDRAIASYET